MKRFMRVSSAFVVVIILSVGICAGPCAGWRMGVTKWHEGGARFSAWPTLLGVRVGEPVARDRYCADFETCWVDLPWWSTDVLIEQYGQIVVFPRWWFSLAAILPDPANPGWYTMPRMDAYLLAKVGCDQVAVPDIVDSFFDVYVSIDVEQWINGGGVVPPPGSMVDIFNGTSPLLPGIQVGWSEIIFDPAYGWVNSNPYTGTMLVLGRMTLEAQIPPYMPLGVARRQEDGRLVNTSGIVTYIGAGFLYIEPPDRSSGIRVETSAPDPTLGDDLQVVGTLATVDGERCIRAVMEPTILSRDNPIPAPFSLRTRDVGGDDLDANNPGVTDGRGALNVGLAVQLSGMVTARDPSPTPQWLYVWDGANRVDSPVNDGSGNYGVRIVSSLPVAAWADWVRVTGVVSTNAMAVPGSVIPEILPTGPPVVESFFDVVASPAGEALTAEWNLVGLPAAPAGQGTGNPLDPKPWDPWMVFGPNKDPSDIDARMYRFENANQSMYLFDMWSEPLGPFGGAVLGDGYWLVLDDAWKMEYSAKASTLDQWISIASAPGWLLAGHPHRHDTKWERCSVHSGNEIKTLYDASLYGSGWLNSVGYWFDNATQSMIDIGLPDDYPSTDTLYPWHGYWFEVYQSNKSLIIPGSVPPELEFHQLDFNLDNGTQVIPDSEWGAVDLTFVGKEEPMYFNLAVDGRWEVQNAPMIAVDGVDVLQTTRVCFDLGVTRGTDVSSISYDYCLTHDPEASMPGGATAGVVTADSIIASTGFRAMLIPLLPWGDPWIGGPAWPWNCYGRQFPNQDCGPDECVPAAVSNSLNYLNDQWGLGMNPWDINIDNMKTATDWNNGCDVDWYDDKDTYMQNNGMPIDTNTINIDQIGAELAAGHDVELSGDWHCAAVVGFADLGGGKYALTVKHDTEQGVAGGTVTETITYDSATGQLSGSPGFFDGSGVTSVVSESPAP